MPPVIRMLTPRYGFKAGGAPTSLTPAAATIRITDDGDMRISADGDQRVIAS